MGSRQSDAAVPRALTLRLEIDQYEALEAAARIDSTTISAAVREAIDAYLDAKRIDPHWQERVQEYLSRNAAVMRRLAP